MAHLFSKAWNHNGEMLLYTNWANGHFYQLWYITRLTEFWFKIILRKIQWLNSGFKVILNNSIQYDLSFKITMDDIQTKNLG